MRTPNLGSVRYEPSEVPRDAAELQRFFSSELLKISAAINALAAGHWDICYVEPQKPRAVDFRVADGTQWNPGSGFGLYGYNGTAWVLIKAL